MKNSVICITGGHLTPALAVIEEIKCQGHRWNMVFLGRSQAFEAGESPTHERRLVEALGVAFYELTTGRGAGLCKVPIGFLQSLFLLLRYRPSAVLTFGGYVALPVAIAAWILGIPVVTHEQTGALGLTNGIIARFARRVLQASESGVPLRRGLFSPSDRPSFAVDDTRPILYITGGSTGAQSLNALIFPIISKLTHTWTVIHQVGTFDKRKAPTPTSRYVIAEYFDVADLAWIYHHAVLVIGRSGANTVAEVAAIGIPALFIPLPWAPAAEQIRNAQSLARIGAAVVVEQETLTSGSFFTHIKTTMQSIEEMKKRARMVAKTYPHDGASVIVKELESILS